MTQIIQITTLQSVIAIGSVLVGVGAAWGNLKTSIKHINKTLDKIDRTLEKLGDTVNSHSIDIAGLKAHTGYREYPTRLPKPLSRIK